METEVDQATRDMIVDASILGFMRLAYKYGIEVDINSTNVNELQNTLHRYLEFEGTPVKK